MKWSVQAPPPQPPTHCLYTCLYVPPHFLHTVYNEQKCVMLTKSVFVLCYLCIQFLMTFLLLTFTHVQGHGRVQLQWKVLVVNVVVVSICHWHLIFLDTCFKSNLWFHPGITIMVDWALKTHYLLFMIITYVWIWSCMYVMLQLQLNLVFQVQGIVNGSKSVIFFPAKSFFVQTVIFFLQDPWNCMIIPFGVYRPCHFIDLDPFSESQKKWVKCRLALLFQVVLETEITNKAALQLYENLGFIRDKRLFRYYLNGVDALRLKLWLR